MKGTFKKLKAKLKTKELEYGDEKVKASYKHSECSQSSNEADIPGDIVSLGLLMHACDHACRSAKSTILAHKNSYIFKLLPFLYGKRTKCVSYTQYKWKGIL